MRTNLIHLMMLLTVSPLIFGEIFVDNGVNCFNACMKCFMMGLSCRPDRPLPSGSQYCLLECMISEERLPGSNVYEIINTIHICRKTYRYDTHELDNCQAENLKLWYPDSYVDFLRTNISGVSSNRRWNIRRNMRFCMYIVGKKRKKNWTYIYCTDLGTFV